MPRRDSAKEKYWRRLLRQWRRSGQTGRVFCAKQGVSEASFYFWRGEIAKRDDEAMACERTLGSAGQRVAQRQSSCAATPTFLKLAFDAGATIPPAIEILVSERRLLRVRPGFDSDLLRQLLRVLEEPSC
jgi:hypothetical protein